MKSITCIVLIFFLFVGIVNSLSAQMLQNDEFDSSGQHLQSFWQVQNGDKSPFELKDGHLVVEGGSNQNLWCEDDTSTAFYQVTDQDQFDVETSLVVDSVNASTISGLVVYSAAMDDWLMLKLWGLGANNRWRPPNTPDNSAVLQFQKRCNQQPPYVYVHPGYNPVQGTIPIAMRLKRDGNNYEVWFKPNAQGDWISVGKTTLVLQGPLKVGVYVGMWAGAGSSSMTVSFDYFRVTQSPTTPVDPISTDEEELPVTVNLSPSPVQSPAVDKQLTFNLNIASGERVAGYQATVQFDTTALRYVSSANADYLPAGAFAVPTVASGNTLTLAATSLAGKSDGDGTLATLTFEVIAVKASTLTLSEMLLSNSDGEISRPQVQGAEITASRQLRGDVNADGTVNILDLVLVGSRFGQRGENAADVNGDKVVNIADLVLVAGAFGADNDANIPDPVFVAVNLGAPSSLHRRSYEMLTATDVKQWLSQAQGLTLADAMSRRGILFLEHLLSALLPKETILLANYPNPFNPETWIPYQLANPADVTVHIYGINGTLIRTLSIGHQAAGMYHGRSRAAYWDGKNEVSEPVASGIYFYTLSAGDFTATRKMLIRK